MIERIAAKLFGPRKKEKPTLAGWMEVERRGLHWRLCAESYVDRVIIERGCFEAATTERVEAFVKPGMRIIDVGANFGYFTAIMAHRVGAEGRVWAFEPARAYRERIHDHLRRNDLQDRATVLDYGLSDKAQELQLSIGESSATLHVVDEGGVQDREQVALKRLDDVYQKLGIDAVDFVKVDIDGHEPFFLDGAAGLLKKFLPVMVIEFSQLNLDRSGLTVMHQAKQLEDLGYALISEKTGKAFQSRTEFLIECGNYAYTANVWAHPRRAEFADAPFIASPLSIPDRMSGQ